MKLFVPHVEKRLDFQSIEFLDTEVFTELHDGRRRDADVVAKLETRDGNPKRVLIHIEIQSRPERHLSKRMVEYYSLLRSRYKLPIFPIVVFNGQVGSAETPRSRIAASVDVVESGLDEAGQLLLIDLVQTYFPLSTLLRAVFHRIGKKTFPRKRLRIPT